MPGFATARRGTPSAGRSPGERTDSEDEMQEPSAGRDRPVGQTSGTTQRPPHELETAVTFLDLSREATALRGEPAWQQNDRNARTFVKEADLRMVLTVLKQ